jgi:hypothetical protein
MKLGWMGWEDFAQAIANPPASSAQPPRLF